MLQWEQHQNLSETRIFFLIALVVERGRLALKVQPQYEIQ